VLMKGGAEVDAPTSQADGTDDEDAGDNPGAASPVRRQLCRPPHGVDAMPLPLVDAEREL